MSGKYGVASRAAWHGRDGLRVANDRVALTVLAQGGALAEFGFAGSGGPIAQNALWESTWLDALQLKTEEEVARAYGDLGVGRFLNRYTGHALCLDGFGPATAEEVRAGAGLHGEAALAEWQFESGSAVCVIARANLPLAQLDVERRISLSAGETIVRVDERITNRGQSSRALHWVQHATVGPPLFDEISLVSASVSRGLTWPDAYEGVPLLAQDAEFAWPNAPVADGGSLNLSRLFAARGKGFVAAARQMDARHFGFVSALHPAKQVALLYLFPAAVFPWVAFWEENCCRKEWPWSGRTQARGLEFGTTPLPSGNVQVDASGPLFDTPVSLPLGTGATVHAPWAMALVQTPPGWTSIDDVIVQPDSLLIRSAGKSIEIVANGIEAFLADAGEAR